MNILVTGVAGFIGFSLAESLLKNKVFKVYGIDNFDNYYSIKLKKERIKILKKYNNFFFEKIDITSNKIFNFNKNKKFDIVFHFAAQAGVRYSLINPKKYINTNINGFIKLIDSLNKSKIKKIIYASSSSVYGDTNSFPTNEKTQLNPKNIYGYTKVINEELSKYYFENLKIPFIGLRFFTIYGVWGRPDMLILKLLKAHHNNLKFELNNGGDHYRDFTSIDDVIKISLKLIKKKINENIVLNISSNKPIYIKTLIKKIKLHKKNLKIKVIKRNKADVYKTHGDNKVLSNFIGYKIRRKFDNDLSKLIKWFDMVKKDRYF